MAIVTPASISARPPVPGEAGWTEPRLAPSWYGSTLPVRWLGALDRQVYTECACGPLPDKVYKRGLSLVPAWWTLAGWGWWHSTTWRGLLPAAAWRLYHNPSHVTPPWLWDYLKEGDIVLEELLHISNPPDRMLSLGLTSEAGESSSPACGVPVGEIHTVGIVGVSRWAAKVEPVAATTEWWMVEGEPSAADEMAAGGGRLPRLKRHK